MTDQIDWVSAFEPKPKPKRGKRTKQPIEPPPPPTEFDHWLSRCIDSGGIVGVQWGKQVCTKGGDPDHFHRKDWSFEYQQTDEDWNPIGEPWVRLKRTGDDDD